MNATLPIEMIREGDYVMVRGGFGRDAALRVLVTGVHAEIKNGRPGIDYELPNGDSRWAYLDQVESVCREPVVDADGKPTVAVKLARCRAVAESAQRLNPTLTFLYNTSCVVVEHSNGTLAMYYSWTLFGTFAACTAALDVTKLVKREHFMRA